MLNSNYYNPLRNTLMDYEFAIFDVDGTLTEIIPAVLAKNPKMVTPSKLGQQQPKPRVVEKLAASS